MSVSTKSDEGNSIGQDGPCRPDPDLGKRGRERNRDREWKAEDEMRQRRNVMQHESNRESYIMLNRVVTAFHDIHSQQILESLSLGKDQYFTFYSIYKVDIQKRQPRPIFLTRFRIAHTPRNFACGFSHEVVVVDYYCSVEFELTRCGEFLNMSWNSYARISFIRSDIANM